MGSRLHLVYFTCKVCRIQPLVSIQVVGRCHAVELINFEFIKLLKQIFFQNTDNCVGFGGSIPRQRPVSCSLSCLIKIEVNDVKMVKI